jgi:hypothetical protein
VLNAFLIFSLAAITAYRMTSTPAVSTPAQDPVPV